MAQQIVQAIIPEATCDLHDSERRIRCGLVGREGEKSEFSVSVANLDRALLEAYARTIKANSL